MYPVIGQYKSGQLYPLYIGSTARIPDDCIQTIPFNTHGRSKCVQQQCYVVRGEIFAHRWIYIPDPSYIYSCYYKSA
jgi:hypothetical protein